MKHASELDCILTACEAPSDCPNGAHCAMLGGMPWGMWTEAAWRNFPAQFGP